MAEEPKIEEIPIYMLPDDAKLFLEFQRHYALFSLLSEKRVFDQKGAAITLHFDNKGVLRTVTRADVLYSHQSNFTNSN